MRFRLITFTAAIALYSGAAVADDWTGAYVGMGGTHASFEYDGNSDGSENLYSGMLGARVGMDGGYVAALEADYSNTNFDKHGLIGIRGLAGIRDSNDNALLFLSVGYAAFQNVDDDVIGGIQLGAGLEIRLTDGVHVRADASRARFKVEDQTLIVPETVNADVWQSRLAVVFQF